MACRRRSAPRPLGSNEGARMTRWAVCLGAGRRLVILSCGVRFPDGPITKQKHPPEADGCRTAEAVSHHLESYLHITSSAIWLHLERSQNHASEATNARIGT